MTTGCGALRDWSPFSKALFSGLIGVMLGVAALLAAPAMAQAQGLSPREAAAEIAASYLGQGFRSGGQLVVKRVSSGAIEVEASTNKTQSIGLTGKNVTVLDSLGNALSLTALGAGMSITFLSRDNDYVFIVVPKEDRSDA